MKNVLITGANRGIGLEFVRQLAAGMKTETANILATCRDPEKAKDLKAIKDSAKVPVQILKLDLNNKDDVEGLLPAVQGVLGQNQGLNLLINNAGYGPSVSLDEMTAEEMNKVFSANTVGPLLVIKALLPLLRKSAEQSSESGMNCRKSAVVNISSNLGSTRYSIPKGPEGARVRNLMVYSASKAALNLLMRYMAVETSASGVLVTLLHPGWVQTDMGSQAAPLTPEESVRDMLGTMASWNETHHGGFFNQNGTALEW